MAVKKGVSTFRELYQSMEGRVIPDGGSYVNKRPDGIHCCVLGQLYCAAYYEDHGSMPPNTGGIFARVTPLIQKYIGADDSFNWDVETKVGVLSIEEAFDEGVLKADEIIEILDKRLEKWKVFHGK